MVLKTSSLTDSSARAAQIVVEFDGVDAGGGGGGKSVKSCQKVEKSSKSPKNLKGQNVAKVIGLEERLPRHQSSVKELELSIEL